MLEPLVLLHGFGGTHRAWDEVLAHLPTERYRSLPLDLPGHGALADAPRPVTFESCVESVLQRGPERFTLVGYSLGGRVALHVALAEPARVQRLVLIGVNPGIEDELERRRRAESDRLLAEELESGPYDEFVERWRTQPLFASESPEVGVLARADQRRNSPDALAAVMRGLSVGRMKPLWDRLAELSMPVTVIVGDRDAKFRELGRRAVRLIPTAELRILPGGHSLPLENPPAVAQAIVG